MSKRAENTSNLETEDEDTVRSHRAPARFTDDGVEAAADGL